MERIQVTITQEKNGTDGTISVTASRNGQNCFNALMKRSTTTISPNIRYIPYQRNT